MASVRPLKILTLDGGGIQALATLTSLSSVCKAVAKHHGSERVPAPHELFDIIGGVGTGGWIALLLGRYRLDVDSCLRVYMDIVGRIETMRPDIPVPKKNGSFKLNQSWLIICATTTLKTFGLDPVLFQEAISAQAGDEDVNLCNYAFAAGIVPGKYDASTSYELFRTYIVPKVSENLLLPGPHPRACSIPAVIAATGAAKYFLEPYKIGKKTFFDPHFPQSHPISCLALDEALGLYGPNMQISVLLNIGPGTPANQDLTELDQLTCGRMTRLARKLGWPAGKRPSLLHRNLARRPEQSTVREDQAGNASPGDIALRAETEGQQAVKDRLVRMYGPSGGDKYYHFGPVYSGAKASLNDVNAISLNEAQSRELMKTSMAQAEEMVRQVWVDVRA